MSQLKLHTPTGVNDILPAECEKKRITEETILEVFRTYGYREVQVPTFEYYDCYVGEDGSFSQDKMFRFFDEKGSLLALRPDFTNSIARMAATKVNNNFVQRYMYNGNVYRLERDHNASQREFTQSGIELIGSYSPKADAEVIATAIKAALATGIKELNVEVGQVAFFNGLAEHSGLCEREMTLLRERIDAKDCVGIQEIIDKLDMSEDIKALLIELPYMFGGREVIERAMVDGLNKKSKEALDNLLAIYDYIADYGMEEYISIDLGMLQSIDYYTGSIFKGYTGGIGFPVFAGGRYDKMMQNFGVPKGAVGVAIGIDRLLSVIDGECTKQGALVFAEDGAKKAAIQFVEKSHINKICYCEMYIGDGNYEDAVCYAKELSQKTGHVNMIIRVFKDGNFKIYDVKTDEETEIVTE